MPILARITCVILMLFGLILVYVDIAGAIHQSWPNWHYLIMQTFRWRWGLGAMAAGAFVAALLLIADALAAKAATPKENS